MVIVAYLTYHHPHHPHHPQHPHQPHHSHHPHHPHHTHHPHNIIIIIIICPIEVMAESSSALQLRYLQVWKYFSDKSHDVSENNENDNNENDNDSEKSMTISSIFVQTLNSISAEKNSTIIFPLPMEMIRYLI